MGNKANKKVNNQVNRMKFLKIIFVLCFFVSSCVSEVIKMKEGVIKTRISCKQLNRISVKNDRIESISGLEEAFSFEKNEKTGDGYIKPSEANGHEPIAISLTTVSGRTQELMLSVDDGDPNTIVLENDEKEDGFEEDFSTDTVSDGGYSGISTSSDYETGIVESMKKLISGECRAVKLAVTPRKNVKGFKINHLESYEIGRYIGEKFEVSSDSNVMEKLIETEFRSEDDVALTFSDLEICKGKKVILYVLVRT